VSHDLGGQAVDAKATKRKLQGERRLRVGEGRAALSGYT
jgi:hypothetical protein